MYYLKHMPAALRKRVEQQMALQHDVDIKRLWRRVPQSVDQAVGGPPMLPAGDIDWPDDSSSSSSSESDASDSVSSSSETPCPQCVTVTVSGMTGDCALANGTWNIPYNVGCDIGSPHYALSNTPLDVDSGESPKTLSIFADYSKDTKRWTVSWNLYRNPGNSYGSFGSEFGVEIDWAGELTSEEVGCEGGTVTLASSVDPCPEDSSSSSDSSSGSSSSDSDDSSSASGSSGSSGDSSSPGEDSSSPGSPEDSSSSGSPGDSSSSPGEESSSDSSSDDGIASNGEVSSGGGDDACGHTACAYWQWVSGNWTRQFFNPSACSVECAGNCAAAPASEGYPGLYAIVSCDGDIEYREF